VRAEGNRLPSCFALKSLAILGDKIGLFVAHFVVSPRTRLRGRHEAWDLSVCVGCDAHPASEDVFPGRTRHHRGIGLMK
jgi:hypothetical protein